MSEAAFGARQHGRIFARKIRLAAVEGVRLALQMEPPGNYSSVGIWPPPDGHGLSDVLHRVAWFLPDHIRVVAPMPRQLNEPAWSGVGPINDSSRLEAGDPLDADLVLLVDISQRRWIRRAVSRKVMIVDPHWYGGEEVETYVAMSSLGTTQAEWHEIDQQSTRLLSDLRLRFAGAASAAVFGTGPSMTSIDPRTLGADAIVACNSAVSNRAWMERAQPAVVAFGDAVFHFGPSKYAERFRQDLRRVAQETDAVFVIPRRFAPLAVRRMPYVADRLIAAAASRKADITDLESRLLVPKTSNVLTRLMLPAAVALADQVLIAGCDGRRPKERYFWQHDQSSQYEDELMNSAFEAHPSFFRDRDYQRYYDRHCRHLEGLLGGAEARGKAFASVTPSEIPALYRRAVN